MYVQMDGASMGSCSGLLLAHIMTKLESSIVDNLFEKNLSKFYIHYIDTHVMLIFVNSRIRYHIGQLNNFHPSLKYTVDKFDDGLHILKIPMQFIIKM